MTDPQIQAWLDQEDARVAHTIRRYGVHLEFVAGGGFGPPPTFAYTVGLFGLGHPELVVCGVDAETAHGLLNDLADRVRAGENFIPGQLLAFDAWPHRVFIEALPNPGEILLSANRHYQRPREASVPAYQLIYDDWHGRFPWDPGYAADPGAQPRPGTWRS